MEDVPMSNFIRLEESKAFLNLEYVTLVTEQQDGTWLSISLIKNTVSSSGTMMQQIS